MLLELSLITLINLYIAWRYSVQPIGPDEGIWMLWGWTGARPYRDYQDCKPPGIHLWMWLLARLTGRRITLSKFIHHATIGALIVGATYATGSIGVGLLATAWIQSAWLLSYQSWMDALSAALLLLAFSVEPGWFAAGLIGLGLLQNVKAGPMGLVYMLLSGMWLEILVCAGVAFAVFAMFNLLWPETFAAMWYGAVTIPDKMRRWRSWKFLGAIQLHPFMLLVPFIGVCLLSGVPVPAGAAAVTYALLNTWGKVWRPNHFLPLAVVVVARPDPAFAAILMLAEALSARLYLGNVWAVTYSGIATQLAEAKAVGERLGQEAGSLWVNTFHTQIYVYARKKPEYGNVEQLEIRDVTPELGRERDSRLGKQPPKWIVFGPGAIQGTPRGYQKQSEVGHFAVLG